MLFKKNIVRSFMTIAMICFEIVEKDIAINTAMVSSHKDQATAHHGHAARARRKRRHRPRRRGSSSRGWGCTRCPCAIGAGPEHGAVAQILSADPALKLSTGSWSLVLDVAGVCLRFRCALTGMPRAT